MINLFESNTDDFAFLLDQMGSDVLIRDIQVKALITNTNLEQNFDDKKITSLSPLSRGDIVVYGGKKYMVISEVNEKRYNKFKGIMRFLPHSIIVNSESRFYTLDCYINTSDLGITPDKVLTLADGEITVNCSNLIIDSDLKLDARFLLNGGAWKVTGIDDFSKPGTVALTCTKDSILPTDDLVNGIAGGLVTVDITSGDFDVTVGSTYQLTWTSTDNAPVRFVSSDESIATVDASGLVTGLTAGSVTITASHNQLEHIKDSVSVTVKDVPLSYTVTITSSSTPGEITKSRTKTYTVIVNRGTDVVTDQPVTWQITADDQVSTTTYAKITSQTGSSCVVSGDALGYVQLKAALVSDPSVFTWLRIRVKSAI